MASTEQGSSIYLDGGSRTNSNGTDAQGIIGNPITSRGSYGGLLYTLPYPLDFDSNRADSTDIKTAGILGAPIGPVGGTTSVKYFKMRGYYTSGSVYETWVSSVSPSLTPPSGHSLVDIAIVAIWLV